MAGGKPKKYKFRCIPSDDRQTMAISVKEKKNKLTQLFSMGRRHEKYWTWDSRSVPDLFNNTGRRRSTYDSVGTVTPEDGKKGLRVQHGSLDYKLKRFALGKKHDRTNDTRLFWVEQIDNENAGTSYITLTIESLSGEMLYNIEEYIPGEGVLQVPANAGAGQPQGQPGVGKTVWRNYEVDSLNLLEVTFATEGALGKLCGFRRAVARRKYYGYRLDSCFPQSYLLMPVEGKGRGQIQSSDNGTGSEEGQIAVRTSTIDVLVR
ncbi:hypothetical protein DFH06DRAFT_1128518 [Mycena polygramma]|nr:hypothetical protein DFH06DRAFT_1128518 [Mycena polygramma]